MNNAVVHPEDVLAVRSRVSWGAIFAGAMVALALYFLLTLLGGAIGLSVRDTIRSGNLETGAAVWAIVATALSLFVGGYVTSLCTVGENKFESVLYGIIMWGVLFGMLLWLMASGVRSGFTAMVGMAHAGQAAVGNSSSRDWEAAAKQGGVSQEQIDQWRGQASTTAADVRRKLEDPQTRQDIADATTRATWWAFAGTLLSMLAAVAEAYLGAGPTYRLLAARLGWSAGPIRQHAGSM